MREERGRERAERRGHRGEGKRRVESREQRGESGREGRGHRRGEERREEE